MATDLCLPPSPSKNEPKKDLIFKMPFILYRGPSKSGVIHFNCPLDQNEMLVWFNLSWPISSQVADAKHALVQAAKETHQGVVKFRYRVEHYQNYLRVLDARLANTSNNEIAAVLYPKLSDHHSAVQRVRDDFDAAKRLRDKDFWLIAVTPQK